MSTLNPPYATSASDKWKKIVFDIFKYAVTAIIGGISVGSICCATGCSFVPVIF